MSERLKPPLEISDGFDLSLATLLDRGLLRAVPGGVPRYVVPREMGVGLEQALSQDEALLAHRRAAAYWLWRVEVLPRPMAHDLPELVESRYHAQAGGSAEQVVAVTELLAGALHAQGASLREEELLRETRPLTTEGSREAAALEHQLALLAERRGRFRAAERGYRRSLAMDEERGDRRGMAASAGQLGVLAQLEGDNRTARAHFERALALGEEVADTALLGRTLHQLGLLDRAEGRFDEAAEHLRAALERRAELADPGAMARTQEAFGHLESDRSELDEATDRMRRALKLYRLAGDTTGSARARLALADLTRLGGDLDAAQHLYEEELREATERGDPDALCRVMRSLGQTALDREEYDEALDWSRRALSASEEEGDRASMAACYQQLALVAQRRGHPRDALRWIVQAVGVYLTIEAHEVSGAIAMLSRVARSVGGSRWQDAWRQAHGADPPPDLVNAVESAWWQRLGRAIGLPGPSQSTQN